MRLSLARAWRTDLPRVVLLLQAGNAFSWFGYGLILPFEIIYLHQFRGFSTATAGLVLGAILGAGTVATPPSGALLDRFRAKPILIAGNLASALGYAGFAFVERPWQAFACAVTGGAGVGVTRTANQTLLILGWLGRGSHVKAVALPAFCDRLERAARYRTARSPF